MTSISHILAYIWDETQANDIITDGDQAPTPGS